MDAFFLRFGERDARLRERGDALDRVLEGLSELYGVLLGFSEACGCHVESGLRSAVECASDFSGGLGEFAEREEFRLREFDRVLIDARIPGGGFGEFDEAVGHCSGLIAEESHRVRDLLYAGVRRGGGFSGGDELLSDDCGGCSGCGDACGGCDSELLRRSSELGEFAFGFVDGVL